MLKNEIIYREILEHWNEKLSQLGLSKTLGFSLSTINNALKPLVAMGAVTVLPRGLKAVDKEKVLLYWASIRNLAKDVLYSTHAGAQPGAVEKSMPGGIVYSAYSAFKFKFHEVPADYSEIYVYCDTPAEVKKRFPPQKGPPNLFVLKSDRRLFELSKKDIAPMSQVFVDLWNTKEWYAKEYIKRLKEMML